MSDATLGIEDPNAAPTPEDAAQLQARLSSAMAGALTNPQTASYTNVRSGAGGSICGEVDSKQADGKRSGFRPFLVSPQGVALVSTTPQILFHDPVDIFPDLYIEWCATPEELRQIGPRLNSASRKPLDSGTPIDQPIPSLPAEVAMSAPPAEMPIPQERRPVAASDPVKQPAGDPDSFSSAVLRPPAKEKGKE
jgi:hypothetical protein